MVAARSYMVSCEETRIENDDQTAQVVAGEDVSYMVG